MTLNSSTSKASFACIRCSDRKVKCDKCIPCSTCTRHNVECIFRQPKPPRRKRKADNNALIEERLRHYEALLQETGIDPNQVSTPSETARLSFSGGPPTLPTPSSMASEQQKTVFKPQILKKQNSTKLVDNSLWSRVAEEIEENEDTLEDSGNDTGDDPSSEDDFTYVLGIHTSTSTSLHPAPDIVLELWRIYTVNVEPIIKIVHVPSLESALEKAITNIEQVPRGFEALMFAMYSIAVLSLTAEDCTRRLQENRSLLLRRYIQATKAALLKAKFMSTNSLVVLQALVLHIFSIRDLYEPRAVWRLTGIAHRVAEGMGMRIDGVLLGLSPFETEMRRRIWWQIKMHDFRAAELCGQSKMKNFELGEDNPKMPTNVDDKDMYPAMSQPPIESSRPTEMLWIMMRVELTTFASRLKIKMSQIGNDSSAEALSALDDLEVKDGWAREMETMLETQFIRYCDPAQPLHLWTMIGCRLSVNLTLFLGHHPRRWASLEHIPESERNLVWRIVISLLEQYEMMQTSPQLRNFAWNIPYFTQWHAIIHALDTLRAQPLHTDAMKVWEYIEHLYERMSDVLFKINRPIFVAIGNLCLKAFSAREAALNGMGRPDTPPGYIKQLREQREAAKTRRETERARKQREEIRSQKTEAITKPVSIVPRLQAQPPLPPSSTFPINPLQGNTRNQDDAFWLSNVFSNDTSTTGAPNLTNLNIDFILAEDTTNSMGNEPIDWSQWDAWFGNIEPIRAA